MRMKYSSIGCSQLKRVQMVLMCEGFIFIIFYIQLDITSSYYMVYKVTRFCMEGFQYGSVNLTIVILSFVFGQDCSVNLRRTSS